MSATEDTPRSGPWKAGGAFLVLAAGVGGAIWAYLASIRYLRDHHAGPGALTAASFVYGAVVLTMGWTFMRAHRGMTGTRSPAARRYTRRFMTAMSVYVFTLLGAVSALRYLRPTGGLAYALAIAPALPLIAAIGVIGLYLREETDEFQRAIQTEAALWATGGMMAIATVWGFLEMFGLVPHVDSWCAFPIWSVLLAPGQLLARRRYR
jgi:xanthosine utilization system XapX-like protein